MRRRRRPAPVLELLDATLPELRRGLTRERGADRCVRAVREARVRRGRSDRPARGACVRRRRRRPPRTGRPADPPRLRRDRPRYAAARPARPSHGVRQRRVPARSGRRRAAAAARRTGRRRRRVRDRRLTARRGGGRDARVARPSALRSAPALRAAQRDDDGASGADGTAFRLQRAEHDRVVHSHRARAGTQARARVRRPSAQPARTAGRVRDAGGGACVTCAATSSSSRRGSARSCR